MVISLESSSAARLDEVTNASNPSAANGVRSIRFIVIIFVFLEAQSHGLPFDSVRTSYDNPDSRDCIRFVRTSRVDEIGILMFLNKRTGGTPVLAPNRAAFAD